MDNFYEQLVITHKTVQYKIMNFLTYLAGILALLMMTTFNFIPAIMVLAVAVGAYFFKKKLYVEYEYDFTNGEIDVDKIVEMKKRTRVLTFNIKDVELLAPENSNYVNDFANKPSKVLQCYPNTSEAQVYVAMITGGNERMQLRFVPNEELLAHCYKYNPRAVKKN